MTPTRRFHPPRPAGKPRRARLAITGLEDRVTPAALRVALVSDAVAQAGAVAAAAGSGVIVRVYDAAGTDTAGLVGLLDQISAEHGGEHIAQLALVAHGSPGRVDVGGGDVWGAAGWNTRPAEWAGLRGLLDPNARLDLYSCSAAAGPAGRALVSGLGRLTGAAVYASTDPVGSGAGADFAWETVTQRAIGTTDLFPAGRLERIAGLRLDDPYEPNDTQAEVDAAAPGGANSPHLGTVTSLVSIPGLVLNDPADWFKVVTTAAGTSRDYARVAFSTSQGDLDIELRAADGLTILQSDTAAFNPFAEVSFAGQPAGTYYVRVFDQAATPNVSYTLTIDPPGNEPDDPFEDNDTRAQVDAAPAGSASSPNFGTVTATATLTGMKLLDGADWFKFTTTGVGTSHDFARIAFNTSAATRDLDLDIELRASDGVTVLQSDTAAFNLFAEVSLATQPAGVYYARVFDNGGNGNSDYTLTVDPPGNEPDDAYEPNDSRTEVDAAPPGGPNSPNLGTLTTARVFNGMRLEDGADWFKFTAAGIGTSHDYARVAFATNAATRDGDLDIELRAGDGVTVLQSDTAAFNLFAEVSLATQPPGTYFVRVFDNSGNANSPYTLTIDPPGNEADDPFEPNDTQAEVDAAPAGGPDSPNFGPVAAARLMTGMKLEDSADWFKFTTTATGTSHDFARITFLTDTAARDGDLDLELRSGDGTTVLQSDTAAFNLFAEVSLAGQPAGTYYLRVFDNSGNANGNYALTLDPPGNEADDAYEENDARTVVDAQVPGAASSPNLGVVIGTLQIPGLKLEDPADWYRFETTAPGTAANTVQIAFATNAATRDGDLDLQLVRADGTVLASDTAAFNLTASASLNGQPAGVYYLRVFDNSGNANADYTLAINPPTGGPALSLSLNPSTVSETAGAGAATGTVTRTGPTASPLVVSLASSRPGEAAVPPTVTIPAGQASATFPVDVADDLLVNGTRSAFLTAYGTGIASAVAGLTLTDNDAPPAVVLTPTGGNTAVTEGGPADTYEVVLTTQPVADVVVTVHPGGRLLASPTTLTFTSANWFVAQPVTVSAVDDAVAQGTQTVVVTHTATSADPRFNGLAVPDLPVGVADNDAADVLVVESGGSTAVSEAGATDTYTVVLASRPTNDVTVLMGTNTQLNVTPSFLTFTPADWNVARPVTVAAVDDAVGEGTQVAVVAHAVQSADPNYNGRPVVGVTVTIADNDVAPAVLLAQSGGGTAVVEGGAADSYAVVLSTQPTADVVVTATFGGQLGVSPAVLTFTPGDWNVPQPVTVTAVNDAAVEGTRTVPINYGVGSLDPNYNNLPAPGVLVTITDDDLPLVAAADVVTAIEDGPATPLAVLGNDSGAGIFISAATPGAAGTVIITGGGTGLTYTPDPDFAGLDSFTYTITDHNGATATAGVLVHVAAANDPPALTLPGPQTVRVNTPLSINGLVVTDPDAFQGTGQVRVSLSVQAGTITLPTTAGLVFSAGDGTADPAMTFTGLLSSVTAALGGLTYAQPTDTLAADTLAVGVSDLGNFGAGGPGTATGSVAIDPLTGQVLLQPNPANPALRDLVVYGTAGGDTVLITAKGTSYTATLNGAVVPAGKVTGRVLLFGQDGNDSLRMPNVARSGVLVGGPGDDVLAGGAKNDRLTGGDGNDTFDGGKGADRLVEAGDVDFTLVQGTKSTDGRLIGLGTDVLVKTSIEEADLTGGAGDNAIDAAGFTGRTTLSGGAGNDVLRAGAGGGLLLGGAGDDSLVGAGSRDVMIGGLGLDALTGGAGDDLLVGGTTAFDADPAALAAVATEWARKPTGYATRIKHLAGTAAGGLNGSNFLSALTVTNDGQANLLTGGDGLDWFFAKDQLDAVTDLNGGGTETKTALA